MSLSSYIWTTFSSILTTFPNTKLTLRKYFVGSALMDCLLVQTNASSMSLLVNTSDICCHPKASPWPHTKSKLSKIGQYHKRLRIFNLSLALPISTIVSSTDIPKSQSCSHVLTARVPLGISLMSAIPPLKHLKKAFTTAPVLTHWIPDTQITVETNASDYALAAVLSITTSNGELHPIAFHSRTFSALELNYDIHDKELLAIFEAFKQWRHYLEGSGLMIDVVTDHRNLQYFSMTKILTRRQA